MMSSVEDHSPITIQDVARRAGVAPITVSRVINNHSYVSLQTRQRVEAAILELQYVPNMLASSLRSNRTNTLALILSDISNPFWTTVARGAEDAASQQGFNVILCNTDENEAKQEEYLSVLLRKRVDGFLFVPVESHPRSIEQIQKQKVPVVVMDRQIQGVTVDIVRGDSEDGAYQLTRHLISLGHRHIAILSGPQILSVSIDRVDGMLRALAEANIRADAQIISYGKFTIESGWERTMELMTNSLPPTAIVAGNNFIAIGALRVLREQGIRVPEDISLASIDDLPPPMFIDPFFTVVAQPAYEIGHRATELLLRRIRHPHDLERQEIVLPTELIIRQSCRSIVDDEGTANGDTQIQFAQESP
jgi:LacI family transcriptional regulator